VLAADHHAEAELQGAAGATPAHPQHLCQHLLGAQASTLSTFQKAYVFSFFFVAITFRKKAYSH
jgi:hypothetical protein